VRVRGEPVVWRVVSSPMKDDPVIITCEHNSYKSYTARRTQASAYLP
jgi:hypothetical protein